MVLESVRIRIGEIHNILKTMVGYRRTIYYILRKKGPRAAADFIFIKLFVSDEGGEFSVLDPLFRLHPSLVRYPYKIELEPTTICDKKCLICEHTYWHENPENLSYEKFRYILDQFPKLRWINITGEGTAYLNKDFIRMLEHLRSRRISVNFVDEFEHVNEEIGKKLIDLGVNCIWISMDGATKETYEKIKKGCDFDKVVGNIRRFCQMKKEMGSPLPSLCFRFVVNKLNVDEMPKFVELIHSFGDLGDGSKVEFVGILKFGEIAHLYIPEVPQARIDETVKKAEVLGVKVAFSHINEPALPHIKYCTAWAEPYIMMGGYVVQCCAVLMSNKRPFLREHCYGNIFEKPMKEIWNSERFRNDRKLIPREDGPVPFMCVGCRAFDTRDRIKKYGISKA